jgi:uncharacterized protein
MPTILLLTISNIFMTFAWYGHLKHKSAPLWIAILASWGIAFVEYCFMVPANRIGSGRFSGAQLKIIQEVITLLVFAVFSVLYLKEQFRWNYAVGFLLVIAAVVVVFQGGGNESVNAKGITAQAPVPPQASAPTQAPPSPS